MTENLSLEGNSNWIPNFESQGSGVSRSEGGLINGRILIVYGGYLAKLSWVQLLAVEYYRKSPTKFEAIYSVMGPLDVLYQDKSPIKNSRIRDPILRDSARIQEVVIIGHSSGVFVTNELLDMLFDRNVDRSIKFTLNNLDGGKVSDKSFNLLDKYNQVCASLNQNLQSLNFRTMIIESERTQAALKDGQLYIIDGSESGCINSKCLHSAVISSIPHNPSDFTLELDYQNFNSRRRLINIFLT